MTRCDEGVGETEEVLEEGEVGWGGGVAEAEGQLQTLFGNEVVEAVGRVLLVFWISSRLVCRYLHKKKRNSRLGGILGHIGDDEALEIVETGLFDGGNKILCQESLGDLGTLAHDRGPVGKFGVVFGGGETDVVALVSEPLHGILVDNSPDETVVTRVFAPYGLLARYTRDEVFLLAVECIGGDLDFFGNRRERVHEEGHDGLADHSKGVVTLVESDFQVGKSDVLSARGIGHEDVLGLLFQNILVGAALLDGLGQSLLLDLDGTDDATTAEADACEFRLEGADVRSHPGIGAAAVRPDAPPVAGQDDQDDGQDDGLHLEITPCHALMHVVPLCVRAVGH